MYVGVVYCMADQLAEGRELEKLADCEVVDVGVAVKAALESDGHRVELVRIDPNRLELLRKFDWIFNLAESVCGFPYPEYEKEPMTCTGLRLSQPRREKGLERSCWRKLSSRFASKVAG